MSNSMDDIEANAQALFIIGSNTSEQHPVFGTMLRRAVRERGAKLIVADPRRIDMVDHAVLHLRQKPGSDIALLNGLMHIILAENWHDQAFIAERCENFDEFREMIEQYPPERASELTGVPVEQLRQAAEIMGTTRPMAVMWAMGITQHIVGVRNVMTLANLQMLLGNMGKPGGGVNPLRGQNNVQGACDMGGLPNVYTAYQSVVSEGAQKKFADAWGATAGLKVGMTITEMMPGIPAGKIKALYVMGEDPVTSDPDSTHIRHCLEELDFLVVQDIFPTQTTGFADVLLPGVSFVEKEGTFTNTERRVQMVRQAIPPQGEGRPDWQITAEMAKRILAGGGREIAAAPESGWDYASPREIMDEVRRLTPSYAGISYERLDRGERLQWPVPSLEHPGTPVLHTRGFARGKGRFAPIDHIPAPELPDDEYPMVLSTGRVLYHWHGGEITRRARGLMAVYGNALIEVNPQDAEALGLGGREDARGAVRVTSRRGSIEAEAWVTQRVPPGMVYANFHFPESPANELTIAALDPVSKIPSYKICAVRVERINEVE